MAPLKAISWTVDQGLTQQRKMREVAGMIHVCPLSKIEETVTLSGARRMVTLINAGTPVTRPAVLAEADHLILSMNDIIEELPDMTLPGEGHVRGAARFRAQLGSRGAAGHPLLRRHQPLDRCRLFGRRGTCAEARRGRACRDLAQAVAIGDAEHPAGLDRRPAARPRRAG